MQKWFYENHIVLNPRKCDYMLIGNHGKPAKIETPRNSLVYSLTKKQVLMSSKNPYVRKQSKILALLPE